MNTLTYIYMCYIYVYTLAYIYMYFRAYITYVPILTYLKLMYPVNFCPQFMCLRKTPGREPGKRRSRASCRGTTCYCRRPRGLLSYSRWRFCVGIVYCIKYTDGLFCSLLSQLYIMIHYFVLVYHNNIMIHYLEQNTEALLSDIVPQGHRCYSRGLGLSF